MAHPPTYDCDTSASPTSVFGNCYTGSFTARRTQNGTIIIHTHCFTNYEPPRRELVETKKEKLDRTSKEKMLASHRIYDQKDMNVIKLKHACKPQHKMSYRHKR